MHLERFSFLDHAVLFTVLPSLDKWPTLKPEGLNRFALLLVMDFACACDKSFERFARLAIAQGIGYFCAWGPGCERAHDLFDGTEYKVNEEEGRTDENGIFVMTTSHAGNTLDEAIWFLLLCAQTPGPPCTDSWLAVVVGNQDWADHVRRRLADPHGDWTDAVCEDAGQGN